MNKSQKYCHSSYIYKEISKHFKNYYYEFYNSDILTHINVCVKSINLYIKKYQSILKITIMRFTLF